jgi:hypothetical protein
MCQQILVNLPMPNFMKTCSAVLQLLQGRTERHGKAKALLQRLVAKAP